MLDTMITVIGSFFFIMGFLLVITACLYIMGKKEDDTIRQDQHYR